MKLSKSIAQKIVDEMMDNLPYNINVMNEEGVIIGSGEKNRIGHIHQASVDVIREKRTVEIFEETAEVKPGINEPLIMEGKVIGVIGITGDPCIVRPFGKLVRVTAALLIEQSKIDEEKHNKRINRQKFYLELAQKKEYGEAFIERAKTYGLDLLKPCRSVVVEQREEQMPELRAFTARYPHYVESNTKTFLFFTEESAFAAFRKELGEAESEYHIGIGQPEWVASESLQQAEGALSVGRKVFPKLRCHRYEELRLLIGLSHVRKDSFSKVYARLDKAELIETLQVYIRENGDINSVAQTLNIHRNTLTYRLERIHQLTGRNPRNLLQLFELLCGIVWK